MDLYKAIWQKVREVRGSSTQTHMRTHTHRWGGVALWKHSVLKATPCMAAELFPASVSLEDFREKIWTPFVPPPEQLDCSCIAPSFWFQPFLSLCVISCSIFKYIYWWRASVLLCRGFYFITQVSDNSPSQEKISVTTNETEAGRWNKTLTHLYSRK